MYEAAPLDPEDPRTSTVFLTDRESDDIVELSAVPAGIRAGNTVHPVISGDGCTVTAVTELQLDVFRDDDTGARWDVYRSRLPECGGTIGNWELVSPRPGSGGIARDDVVVAAPPTSRGGNLIAYTHPADHLFDAAGVPTISLVDVTVPIDAPERSRFVAGSPADSATDTFLHRGLDQPVLSADGRHLAYRSDATSAEAVPGWAPGVVDGDYGIRQVFAWELDEADPFQAVQLISVRPDGTPSSGAGSPDISRDGTVVAFTSADTQLTDAAFPMCDTDCPTQVFAADRDRDNDGLIDADAMTIAIVSARNGADGLVAGSAPSTQPSLSGDGQLVAFVTKSTDLLLVEVPGIGAGDDGDLLLAQLRNGQLSRLTDKPGGVIPTYGVHAHPDLSDTGRTVVFDTAAAPDLLGDESPAGRRVIARSADPQLSLADVDLGTTLVGRQSDEWYVAVINDGPSSFEPSDISITNARFAVNTESPQNTCQLAATVPAGGSCTVALSFTPTAPGSASAVLTVSESGFGSVSVSSTVQGAGGDPALRLNPAGADLGVVPVGQPSLEFQFDLSNIGFAPTELFETHKR